MIPTSFLPKNEHTVDVNIEKLLMAAMKSPIGTLVLVVIFLWLLTHLLDICSK